MTDKRVLVIIVRAQLHLYFKFKFTVWHSRKEHIFSRHIKDVSA